MCLIMEKQLDINTLKENKNTKDIYIVMGNFIILEITK